MSNHVGVATGGRWTLGRRPALDGLRGVAIAFVLLSHVLDHQLATLGSDGVTIFFALSGFLITSLLVEEHTTGGRVSYRAFYLRRARRLLPALVVMLIPVVAWEAALGASPGWAVVSVLGYASNWFAIGGGNLFLLMHTWSLAIEEQFYLVVPVLLGVALRRLRPATLAWTCGLLATASMAWRLLLWALGAPAERIYEGTDTRCDALLVGCAVALALHAGWRPSPQAKRVTVVALGVVAVMGTLPGDFFHGLVGPTLTAGLAPVLLLGCLDEGWLATPALRWLGARSYGVYLWHLPLVYGLQFEFGHSLWLACCGALVALAVAEASWRWVERPVLSRSRRRPVARLPEHTWR